MDQPLKRKKTNLCKQTAYAIPDVWPISRRGDLSPIPQQFMWWNLRFSRRWRCRNVGTYLQVHTELPPKDRRHPKWYLLESSTGAELSASTSVLSCQNDPTKVTYSFITTLRYATARVISLTCRFIFDQALAQAHSKDVKQHIQSRNLYEISGSHGGEDVYGGLLGYDAGPICTWVPTFWKWRQYIPPKRWFLPTSPHGVTTQDSNIEIVMLAESQTQFHLFVLVQRNEVRVSELWHFMKTAPQRG
jgi:hypothetical protein